MNDIVKIDNQVANKIIEIRSLKVIIDSDVAELYGVQTREINQAVTRNLDRFPDIYLIGLTLQEKEEVITNCDHLQKLKFSPVLPRAFTEQGLYMLATILKSPKAIQTTMAIINTFSQVREISRTIADLVDEPENSPRQKSLMEKASQLVGNLVVPDDSDLKTVSVKTTTKIKFLSMIEIIRETIKEPR